MTYILTQEELDALANRQGVQIIVAQFVRDLEKIRQTRDDTYTFRVAEMNIIMNNFIRRMENL